MNDKSSKLIKNQKRNLLNLARRSIGTDLFRNLFVVDEDGQDFDVLNDGELSCAIFVSSLLALVGWIDGPHATVKTTVGYFENTADWMAVTAPQPGDIIEWGMGEAGHAHLGVVAGDGLAISNSAELRYPVEHSFTMPDGREPVQFWRFVGV